ncbi:MAG: hypothetical protein GX621_08025 [Pirellulaceae bacterium]|nr:hypothetical protein [Pirellulaceae bacterium]
MLSVRIYLQYGTHAKRRRSGYILLIVLTMILMAGLLATSAAHHGLMAATQSALAEEELQRRWGVISCRQAVLNRAEILLKRRELQRRDEERKPPRLETSILLGGVRFQLRLADEQAKLNLNTIFSERGERHVDRVIRELTDFSGSISASVLTPHPHAVSGRPHPPAFDSWGQVFCYERFRGSRSTNELPRAIMTATEKVTCWGDGRLNISRAEKAVLHATCRSAVNPEAARRFVETWTRNPHWNLDRLLGGTDLKRDEQQILKRFLTDGSRCHSLWIHLKSGKRRETVLSLVRTSGQAGDGRITTFHW